MVRLPGTGCLQGTLLDVLKLEYLNKRDIDSESIKLV